MIESPNNSKLTRIMVEWLSNKYPSCMADRIVIRGHGVVEVHSNRVLVRNYSYIDWMDEPENIDKPIAEHWFYPSDPDFFSKIEKHLELKYV